MQAQGPTVGLYLHIPFCMRKCPYCAFFSEPVASHDPAAVINAMFLELQSYQLTEPVETIYIGGGSPTCIEHKLLIDIVFSLSSCFKSVREFTIECNPAQADLSLLKSLFELGVNRISIGAQSFNDAELTTLGRIHSAAQISEAVSLAKQAGFKNISIDLIFGIPGSTLQTFQKSLNHAIALYVQHISAYSLTIETGTPLEKAVRCGKMALPEESLERTMYQTARLSLKQSKFKQYEISNFAKPGFKCLHNIRYWRNQPVIGIGPSAAGWYKGKRTTNVADIEKYVGLITAGQSAYIEEQRPSDEQVAHETAVLNLRMLEGIDIDDFKKQTGFNALELFEQEIASNVRLGLLEQTPTRLRLTEKGLSFADSVASDFA